MLENMNAMLCNARRSRCAVAALNVYSVESIRGALLAAEDCRMPVILAFGARYQANFSLPQAAALVRMLGEESQTAFALHLDHCGEPDTIRAALDAGFTSVMYDGSRLPWEENIANTRRVVRMARVYNASVEAELGGIGTGAQAAEDSGEEAVFTRPREAQSFVEQTQVDALAVSIGTVHGLYRGEPHLRIDLLEQIRQATPVPLVLHGGSGTGARRLQEAVAHGICKVNVNTELSLWCVDQLKKRLNVEPAAHLSELSLLITESFRQKAARYIRLLGMELPQGNPSTLERSADSK